MHHFSGECTVTDLPSVKNVTLMLSRRKGYLSRHKARVLTLNEEIKKKKKVKISSH